MELVGGVLIVLGLFTRPVAFVLSGFMAAAYFMAHFPMSFFPAINFGEPAVLFCFMFLYLAAAGPGPWSIDKADAKPRHLKRARSRIRSRAATCRRCSRVAIDCAGPRRAPAGRGGLKTRTGSPALARRVAGLQRRPSAARAGLWL